MIFIYEIDMKLILVTTDNFFVEENIIINTLFDEGLDVLHLRKPYSEPILCERLLKLTPEKLHKKIVVHDHFYLKEEFGLKGIHLNKRNPEPPIKYRGHLSRTCSTFEEVKEWKKKCDYVFLSPIFEKLSPVNDQIPFDIRELKKASAEGVINKNVIALGGVTVDNVKIAKDLGFGGVGIMGAVWQNFDFHSSADFKKLIDYFKKIREAAN
jgi:thiamine-phosphate pyrophosphorylase